MKYMLDTHICIYIINERPQAVRQRFEAHEPGSICVSAITAAELAHGVTKGNRQGNRERLERFLSPLRVLPWGEEVMWAYAQEKSRLSALGQRIGDLDLLIACHALQLGMCLVTNNTREFERVQGLQVEHWA
jgi:tRNA(fMet)-specific endonuclease VapC